MTRLAIAVFGLLAMATAASADATGEFNFDGPRHCTAIITSSGKMAGTLISDVITDIQAERVGDCTQ